VDQDEGMPTASSIRSSVARHGAELIFETLDESAGPARVHRAEDTLLRVIDGIVRLVQDGCERLLGTGDEAIVPAGATHRLSSAGGRARVVIGFRTVS
jgi:mannose-6-phosphate isomerase-like protein (cupin superfamily)